MRSRTIFSLTAATAAVLIASANIFATPAQTLNLPDPGTVSVLEDDTIPDVTARVARISFISGDVQIRRFETQDWEKATLNLPIVEGDEITTANNSRLEIQFNSYTHLRLSENASLTVVKLKDDGIAVSLPQGTMSVRLNQFDKDRAYFEIDAPGSTIAAQRSGMYRIDAGDQGGSEIRVTVTDEGEARIYSESTGFKLKSGRSARVFVTGNNAGEWETANADTYADEFDSWALVRDSVIAKSLQNAYYDKYYDRDIYGADDLNDYGEWVYTRNYGYVWRPYRSATSSYVGWSPYRYGQWRWIPPYGWTWVNDEPWGWATYHHGRWFYDAGYWYWTPYGYYRTARSWWSPALVIISIFGGNVCWYPLPYSYAYYNYNSYYYSHGGWGGHYGGGNGSGGNGGGGGGGVGPTPTPTPGGGVVVAGPLSQPKGPKTPPLGSVPTTGVITVPVDDFGRLTKGNRTPPLSVATSVLSKVPDDRTSAPILPVYRDIKSRVSRDIVTEKPRIAVAETNVKTGAMTRKTDAPLDAELQTTRVLGGRPPLQTRNEPVVVTQGDTNVNTQRKTGAVERPPTMKPVSPPETVDRTPRKVTEDTPDSTDKPSPRYTPPIRQETPRYEAPQSKPEPRYVPPPRQEPPRYDPPPTKPSAPPKTESRPDKKPDPPADTGSKKKDGR